MEICFYPHPILGEHGNAPRLFKFSFLMLDQYTLMSKHSDDKQNGWGIAKWNNKYTSQTRKTHCNMTRMNGKSFGSIGSGALKTTERDA